MKSLTRGPQLFNFEMKRKKEKEKKVISMA